jgi:pimeloyl-ACP methyl ester carboxylesterase
MGGRIALLLLEKMPEKIQRVVLLAPDGLKVNRWYWLVTQTWAGNRLFRWTMGHPGWFFFMLRAGNALKLVNLSIYKFVDYYISNDQVRRDLYTRWTTLRGFRPDLTIVRETIPSKKIPVRLIYGRYDRIIRWERGQQFRRGGPEPYCELIILPQGHQLLQLKNLDVLLSALK